MKIVVLVSFFLFSMVFLESSSIKNDMFDQEEIINYQKIFGNDYTKALNFIKVNKKFINSALDNKKLDKSILVSVLFPERIRYSIISDYVETEINENLYTSFGSEYVDFSIGYFQMKPSFIEKIEAYLISNEELNSFFSTTMKYNAKTDKEIRKERIIRLKSFNWQLKYAEIFYYIVESKFDLEKYDTIEKIEFFAAAYNFGFDKSQEKIEKTITETYFPYGNSYPGKQYSYSKIASFFYINNYKSIFLY